MFSALKPVVDVVSHITSWGGGANYTCIVFCVFLLILGVTTKLFS